VCWRVADNLKTQAPSNGVGFQQFDPNGIAKAPCFTALFADQRVFGFVVLKELRTKRTDRHQTVRAALFQGDE
jgi:hypothetical protein